MLMLHFNKLRHSLYLEIFGDKDWAYFWEARFIPRWIPLLLGTILALMAAFLINDQAWHYLFPLALIVPAAILFSRYPFIAVILWLLLTQFFIDAPNAAQRFIFWILYRAMPPATIGIVLLSSWLNVSKKKTLLGRADLVAFIFLLATVANLLLLTEGRLSREFISLYDQIFIPLCMYWLIRLIAPDEQDLKWLVPVLFIAAVAQSTVGLMQWFIPQALPPQWVGLAGERTTGTLSKAGVYTSLLLFSAIVLFQHAMNTKSQWTRSLFLLVIGLTLACVFFSFSRASWLGGIFVLTGLMFIYPNVVIRSTIILFVVMFILGNGVLAGQMNQAWERLNSEDASESANSRVVQNYGAMRMIQLKPFFGWGWSNYNRYDSEFYTRVGDDVANITKDQTVHNTYLFLIAELGLIIFIIFLFPFFWWFWLSIKIWSRLPRTGFWSRSLLLMFWLVIGHISIVSFFIPMYSNYYGTSLLFLILGLIAHMIDSHLEPGDIGVYHRVQRQTSSTKGLATTA